MAGLIVLKGQHVLGSECAKLLQNRRKKKINTQKWPLARNSKVRDGIITLAQSFFWPQPTAPWTTGRKKQKKKQFN